MPTASTLVNYRFPQDFGVYHAPGSHTKYVCLTLFLLLSILSDGKPTRDPRRIAASASSPPQFYISTHGGFSSHPSVVLHSGPSSSLPSLATVAFHSFSSAIDIAINNQTFPLVKDGRFPPPPSFSSFSHLGTAKPSPGSPLLAPRWQRWRARARA